MSPRDNSGPAFPGERIRYSAGYPTNERDPVPGMTLRDYFAAKAMQVVASGSFEVRGDFLPRKHFESAAEDAYAMADAMLKAREA